MADASGGGAAGGNMDVGQILKDIQDLRQQLSSVASPVVSPSSLAHHSRVDLSARNGPTSASTPLSPLPRSLPPRSINTSYYGTGAGGEGALPSASFMMSSTAGSSRPGASFRSSAMAPPASTAGIGSVRGDLAGIKREVDDLKTSRDSELSTLRREMERLKARPSRDRVHAERANAELNHSIVIQKQKKESELRKLEIMAFDQQLELQKYKSDNDVLRGKLAAAEAHALDVDRRRAHDVHAIEVEARSRASEVSSLQATVQSLTADAAAHGAEMEEMKSILSRREKDMEALRARNRELSETTVELSDRVLVDKDREIARLTAENDDLAVQNTRLTSANRDLDTQNRRLQTDIEGLVDATDNAGNAERRIREEHKSLGRQLADAQVELAHLRQERAALNEELKQKSRAYAETVSDRNRILQSLETTEEELKEMSSQVATLSSQVVAAREAMGAVGRVAALEEEVAFKEKEIGSLRARIDALDEEVMREREVVASREDEIAAVQATLDDARLKANRVEGLEEERRLDRELHERQEAELGDLRNQLSAFREELEASERGMRARERDVEEVKAMLAAQEEEMSARLATAEHTHRAQLDEYDRKLAELRGAHGGEIDEAAARLADAQEELSRMDEHTAVLRSQVSQLEALVETKDEEIVSRLEQERQLAAEFMLIKEQALGLSTALETAKLNSIRQGETLQELEAENATLRTEAAAARVRITELETEVRKATSHDSQASMLLREAQAAADDRGHRVEELERQVLVAIEAQKAAQAEARGAQEELRALRREVGDKTAALEEALRVGAEAQHSNETRATEVASLRAELAQSRATEQQQAEQINALLTETRMMEFEVRSRLEREARAQDELSSLRSANSGGEGAAEANRMTELTSKLKSQLSELMQATPDKQARGGSATGGAAAASARSHGDQERQATLDRLERMMLDMKSQQRRAATEARLKENELRRTRNELDLERQLSTSP